MPEILRIGHPAPDFQAIAVIDQEFKTIKLSDYRGSKNVVLFFYPLDFTFVCPTEVTAFSDRHSEFLDLDTEILGISVDSEFCHLAWIQNDRSSGGVGDLNYPLVSDLTKSISTSYQVLIPELGYALRGLFIIDKSGILQHLSVNNPSCGRSIDDILRTLRAVHHLQNHRSELCPVDWQVGNSTVLA